MSDSPLVYSTPLRSRFRGLTTRDGVLLPGVAGWGEFSPFWDYDAPTSLPWLRAALETAERGWPRPLRDRIPVNVTVPAVGPERAHEIVTRSGGCTTAKVKVAERGQSLREAQARLEAVRDALGPAGRIRIDANAGWDLEEALAALAVLDRAAGGLEYVEQPCPSVADLAHVRRAQHVPVAADESIRRAEDPLAVKRAEAADIVVLKVQPLGGVRACLDLAEQVELPVVVSSALESSFGIAAGLALAAALPELPHACGLATVHLFERDAATTPLLPTDGTLPVLGAGDLTPREGLAGSVDPDGHHPGEVDPALRRAWLTRLQEVRALAGEGRG
ncbi:o-succinylbenzoate synthase [Serinibacter salmoneus]|uniref:o-succinylbenzoate synthase n=1 Tax=Serinibacter salmoneus TaxID=556530 RepID=A0A2A9D3M8_9MICO|nr:o-succinylbenzoate synthase [Serinibacter salmoneus]PFG20562.1 O-succinylbenzoate synthase [Serinibacter salmoneus]